MLVRLVGDESKDQRSGRDLVLSRLVEILLIEALQSSSGDEASPGLLRGLADARLAPAIRQIHAQIARSWTVAELAKAAALSRSVFFDRFSRMVGLTPMEYLLAWRMAVARDLLRQQELGITDVAARVGYGSASTFSTAFRRHVGQPPRRYARGRGDAASVTLEQRARRPGSGGAVREGRAARAIPLHGGSAGGGPGVARSGGRRA